MSWLEVTRGDAPLVVALPHTGTDLLPEMTGSLVSPWLARKDADWFVDRLYDFASGLGATLVRMRWSRTVIDVNRDPSGASLYPGMATTGLCPVTTFDGESLYRPGGEPDEDEVELRRTAFHTPYHAAVNDELERLLHAHRAVVLYDAHSIRSRIPRLFEGHLPIFNIGTAGGTSCDPVLARAVSRMCAASGLPWVCDGRFKGGWTTRHHGQRDKGVHAIQMELAMRGYLHEPEMVSETSWPPEYDDRFATGMQSHLKTILEGCLAFAEGRIE